MITLTEEVREKFIEHALRQEPREACGLVAIIKGKQQYFECENIAEGAGDFLLNPADYIQVDDLVEKYAGDIVAVVHSHPYSSSKPSMADKVGCERSGLQWFIYSTKEGEWSSLNPTGYKAPLIGRSFKHGIFDCFSAVKDWYKENMSIEIPEFDRENKWWEKGQNIILENFQTAGFSEVKDGSIKKGDIILINMASPVTNHMAVYIGNDQVFHQTMNRLSSREIYGGMLKKNTRMVVRYSK